LDINVSEGSDPIGWPGKRKVLYIPLEKGRDSVGTVAGGENGRVRSLKAFPLNSMQIKKLRATSTIELKGGGPRIPEGRPAPTEKRGEPLGLMSPR